MKPISNMSVRTFVFSFSLFLVAFEAHAQQCTTSTVPLPLHTPSCCQEENFGAAEVQELIVHNDKLFAAGEAEIPICETGQWLCGTPSCSCSSPASSLVVQWNNATNQFERFPLLSSCHTLQGRAYAMASFQGELYVGGDFLTLNDDCHQDAISCSSSSPNSPIYCDSGLGWLDPRPVRGHLAKWNAGLSDWERVGNRDKQGRPGQFYLNGPVHSLAVFDDGSGPTLYVGGDFTGTLDGEGNFHMPLNHIAKWDGISWSAVGGGTEQTVWALLVEQSCDSASQTLYVSTAGSAFDENGVETVISGVGTWNGFEWTALGSLTEAGGTVHALEFFDAGQGAELIAGGYFSLPVAGLGYGSQNIAKWNGAGWVPLTGGVSGGVWQNDLGSGVTSLISFDDGEGTKLYVGGKFDHAGGDAAWAIGDWPNFGGIITHNLVRWNGQSWSNLPQMLPTGFDQEGLPTQGGRVNTLLAWNDPNRAPDQQRLDLYSGGSIDASLSSDGLQNLIFSVRGCSSLTESSSSNSTAVYGDVNGDGIVNLVDILMVLFAFNGGVASCNHCDLAPCGGNGNVNLDDILRVLMAFSGDNPCNCW